MAIKIIKENSFEEETGGKLSRRNPPPGYSLEWYDEVIDAIEEDIDVLLDIKSINEIGDSREDDQFHFYRGHVYKRWLEEVEGNPREFKRRKLEIIKSLQEVIENYKNDKEKAEKKAAESEALIKPMKDYIESTYDFVDYDDNAKVIYFNAPGAKYINDVVKDIAKRFNLKTNGFGFDSSFTTHEAVTPENRALLRIGLVRKDGPSECFVGFDDLRKVNGVKTPRAIF